MTVAEEASLLRSKLNLMASIMSDEAATSGDEGTVQELSRLKKIIDILRMFPDDVLVNSFNDVKDSMPEALKGIFE